jgi:hypothetical protein
MVWMNSVYPHPTDEELHQNWPTTPWACTIFNCEQQTVCLQTMATLPTDGAQSQFWENMTMRKEAI